MTDSAVMKTVELTTRADPSLQKHPSPETVANILEELKFTRNKAHGRRPPAARWTMMAAASSGHKDNARKGLAGPVLQHEAHSSTKQSLSYDE